VADRKLFILLTAFTLAASPPIAVAQFPYFIWISLASFLQPSITATNWGMP
jgi:tryptophan-rich sensory protein